MEAKTQTQIAVPSNTAGSLQGSLLLNVGGGLALIVLFAVLFTRVARKFGFVPSAAGNARLLTVKASVALGQKERVVIVEAENRWLVLGVTAGSITPLTQFDKPLTASQEEVPQKNSMTFPALMKAALKGQKPGDPS